MTCRETQPSDFKQETTTPATAGATRGTAPPGHSPAARAAALRSCHGSRSRTCEGPWNAPPPLPSPEERGGSLSPRPSHPSAPRPRGGGGRRLRPGGRCRRRVTPPGLGSRSLVAMRASAPRTRARPQRGAGRRRARGAPGRQRRAASRERGGSAARGRCAVPRGARPGRAATRAPCRRQRRQRWRSSRRGSAPRTAGERPPLPGRGWVRERVTQRR